MRALVVGGSGFLGSHLCQRLLRAGHDCIVYDRHLPSMNIPFMKGELHERDKLANAVQGMDWVFHLKCTTIPSTSNADPHFDVTSNVGPTLHLLDACRAAQVRRIVFASSGGTVYGITEAVPITEDHPTVPVCSYGITKLTIEKYLHLYYHLFGLDYVIMRVGNLYGLPPCITGEQGVIANYLRRIICSEPLPLWGDGGIIRDYIHAQDVADAFVSAAATTCLPCRIFNIGSGTGTSLQALLDLLREVTNRPFTIQHLPARLVDIPRVILNITRAAQYLNWGPRIGLPAGLKMTWKALRAQVIPLPSLEVFRPSRDDVSAA
jgi:UDP-glucose 4-epimerase